MKERNTVAKRFLAIALTLAMAVTLTPVAGLAMYGEAGPQEVYATVDPIENISLNEENGTLTWPQGSGAGYYQIFIGDALIAEYYYNHWDSQGSRPDPVINIYKIIDAKIYGGTIEKSASDTYSVRIAFTNWDKTKILSEGQVEVPYASAAAPIEKGELSPSFDAESLMLSWASYEDYVDPSGSGLGYKYTLSTPGFGERMNQGTDQTSVSVSSMFWYLEHNFLAKDGDPEVLTVEAILCTDPSDSENTTYTVAEGSVDVTYQSLSAPLSLTVDEENQRLTWDACTEQSFDHYGWLIRSFDDSVDMISLGTDTSLSFAAIQARLDQRHEDYGLPELETYDVYVFALDANDEWIAKGIYPYYYEQELEKEFGEVELSGTTLTWGAVDGAAAYRVIVPGNHTLIEDANTADVGQLLDEAYTDGELEGYESPYSVVLEAGYYNDDDYWVPIARWKGSVEYTPSLIHDHDWEFKGFTITDEISGRSISFSATADYECSSCGEKKSIQASGRSNGVTPSCTEGSHIDYTAWISAGSSLDGEYHQDVKGFDYEAWGHDLTHMSAKDATEDEKGNIECWKCEQCWRYFLDEAATQEVPEAEAIIPQLKKDLSKSEVSLEGLLPGIEPIFPYDGESHRPGWEITYNGGKVNPIYFIREIRDSQDNVVTDPVNAGKYWMVFTAKETSYTGEKRAAFTIVQAEQSITAKAGASSVAVGKTTTISVTGAKGTVKKTYKSSDTKVATVDSAGKVTAKKVGTAKITVTAADTEGNYKSDSKTVTIKVVPAATSSITVSNLATGTKVTWKKVTGATGYKIYRNGTLIKTITSGSTLTYSDTKANTNGTKYTYKIVAKAGTGDSTLSKSKTFYRVSRPVISSLTNSAAGKMTVKWGKNAKATGYEIQYSTSKTFASGNKIATVSKYSTVSKVISSLTKGKTYYVRVRTYKTVSGTKYVSAWSAVKNVKIAK